jgi:hypothetical protein
VTVEDINRDLVLETARAIIEGKTDLIAGCRSLASLAHDIVPDWTVDRDFGVFGVFASDTDHLPVGPARQHWSREALEIADGEIAAREADNHDAILDACHRLTVRFGSFP